MKNQLQLDCKLPVVLVIGLLFGVFIPISTSAQSTVTRQNEYNLSKSHLAIKGFDPVSYFEGEPREGRSDVKAYYRGVTYYFTGNKHKEEFLSNPGKYEPMYGGWCAYAMGETGEKVKINPKTFKIINGKVYLFYDFFLTNTLDDWNKDEKNLKIKADKNWGKLINPNQ